MSRQVEEPAPRSRRPEDREGLGITADLVRVSCGIEGLQDLIADFSQALAKIPS